jgi:AraC family transcriptional regulator
MQTPVIKSINAIYLIGLSKEINRSESHKIVELWKSFMPIASGMKAGKSTAYFAVQIYQDFSGNEKPYTIWAATEKAQHKTVPDQLKHLQIPSGLYAVVELHGMDIAGLYQNFMSAWLPQSDYTIDNRPHFQIMGEDYKNGSPDSKEHVCIPIKAQ